ATKCRNQQGCYADYHQAKNLVPINRTPFHLDGPHRDSQLALTACEFDTVRHILLACLAGTATAPCHGIARPRTCWSPRPPFSASCERFEAMNFGIELLPERSRRHARVLSHRSRFASNRCLAGWTRARASIGGSGATGEGGEFECCLVGNKADEEYRRLVSHREAQRYANQLGKAFVDLTLAIMRSRLPLQEDRSQTAAVKLRQQKAQQRLQSSAEAFTDEAESIGYRRRRKLACNNKPAAGKAEDEADIQASPSPVPAKKIELRKEIGVLQGVGIIVGCIVGSGIFVSPKGILQESKSVGLSFIMWAVTGIFSALGAVCYAELGTTIPGPGGRVHLRTAGASTWAALPAFSGALGSPLLPSGLFSNAANSLLFAKVLLSPLFVGCPVPELLTRATAFLSVGSGI
uniref:AA_permease domain-containing protein n=1 Tax=Macrostomum lignano TaxID=282301 RepID=A0A1I8JR17_9PLAT